MSLSFPNSSRSYDPVGQRIRFVGHDGMFQISFSIPVAVVSRDTVEADDAENDYLSAFDAARTRVQDVASKAYARTRKSTYSLTSADF